jgi:hypothetical protein
VEIAVKSDHSGIVLTTVLQGGQTVENFRGYVIVSRNTYYSAHIFPLFIFNPAHAGFGFPLQICNTAHAGFCFPLFIFNPAHAGFGFHLSS